MKDDSEALGTHFEHLEAHLDHVAARAMPAAAELRVQSQAILESLRAAMEPALHDLGESLDVAARGAP